jgi:hypothetical protein
MTVVVPHPPRKGKKTNTQKTNTLTFVNTNLCMAFPVASNHSCPSMRCEALFIGPLGWWLYEGVHVGERELQ